jgi:hypothetical protein
VSEWIRARFHANLEDSRPITFPPPGPFWETGFGEDYAIVVAYVRDEAQITEFWPEATHIDAQEVDEIVFTDRFAKPDWWEAP